MWSPDKALMFQKIPKASLKNWEKQKWAASDPLGNQWVVQNPRAQTILSTPQTLKVRAFPAQPCWSEPPCWSPHTSYPCWSPGSPCWWVWQAAWPVPPWRSYCRACVTSDCRGADSRGGSAWRMCVSWARGSSVASLVSSVQWKGCC